MERHRWYAWWSACSWQWRGRVMFRRRGCGSVMSRCLIAIWWVASREARIHGGTGCGLCFEDLHRIFITCTFHTFRSPSTCAACSKSTLFLKLKSRVFWSLSPKKPCQPPCRLLSSRAVAQSSPATHVHERTSADPSLQHAARYCIGSAITELSTNEV